LLPAMSDRDRRALAAGATCIVFMVVLGRVLPAERKWQARAEIRAALLSGEVADARAVLSREKTTRDSVAARASMLKAVERDLLRAESKASGEATLAALVSAAAASSGIKVDALALDGDGADPGPLHYVSVSGDATGDIESLATFLAAIERAPARVAFRALSITQSDAGAPDIRAENLRLEFTVQAQVISTSRARP